MTHGLYRRLHVVAIGIWKQTNSLASKHSSVPSILKVCHCSHLRGQVLSDHPNPQVVHHLGIVQHATLINAPSILQLTSTAWRVKIDSK